MLTITDHATMPVLKLKDHFTLEEITVVQSQLDDLYAVCSSDDILGACFEDDGEMTGEEKTTQTAIESHLAELQEMLDNVDELVIAMSSGERKFAVEKDAAVNYLCDHIAKLEESIPCWIRINSQGSINTFLQNNTQEVYAFDNIYLVYASTNATKDVFPCY